MNRHWSKVRNTLFLFQSLVLFGLLYLLFFVVGGAAFWYGCLLSKHKLVHGSLPYDLPSPLPIILLFGGLLLIYKMLDSLLAIKKIDRPDLKEITAEEYPALFELINETAKDMFVKPPQHVYLSATASASVFLDTGFWNAFFPAKKKLEIGLGLIRFLNREELRAIIAHELGHFSQRSMALNAPVYVVGQSIRHLTKSVKYKKRGTWEDHTYILAYFFRTFADLLFSRLSKNFASFSEELEFDADRVAVEYIGKEPLVSALLKVSFASKMFNNTLYCIYMLAQEGKGFSDFYAAQYYTAVCFLLKRQESWSKDFISTPLPCCPLSKLTKHRLEKLQGIEKPNEQSTATILYPSTRLFPDFDAECWQFTHGIYRNQFGIGLSELELCSLSFYVRKMLKYFGGMESTTVTDSKVEVEIMLEKDLHRIPLIEYYFDVYWDGKKLGKGRCRKGFTLKTKTYPGKHKLEIEGAYIRDIPIPVEIKDTGKQIIKLDYEYRFMKSDYRFFMKEIGISDDCNTYK